jgi:type I restriction enzyme S subunit
MLAQLMPSTSRLSGGASSKPLRQLVTLENDIVNPQAESHKTTLFQYLDLAEVDEALGAFLLYRELNGRDVASAKTRFRTGDILFAKIRPSIDNKKIAYVFQELENAIASTEFLVLRPIQPANAFYIFAALRSDDFTRQVIASCGGDTGRQRVPPGKLLNLMIPWADSQVRQTISKGVSEYFSSLSSAFELHEQAIALAKDALGQTTFRTAKPRRKPTKKAAGRPSSKKQKRKAVSARSK